MNIYLGQFILKKLKMKSYADKGGESIKSTKSIFAKGEWIPAANLLINSHQCPRWLSFIANAF